MLNLSAKWDKKIKIKPSTILNLICFALAGVVFCTPLTLQNKQSLQTKQFFVQWAGAGGRVAEWQTLGI